MRPFLLWRSDWPVVGQHLCSILFCVACSGAPDASLSTMRAFSIMRLSVFCCARWVEGIFSFIDCCWSTLLDFIQVTPRKRAYPRSDQKVRVEFLRYLHTQIDR